jgi:hypothetical protein
MIPETTKAITVDWLNEALHASGFLGDASITAIQHEPMGLGEGFMSDMARLALTYDRQAPHLPASVVAKLPTAFESARAVGMLLRIYEREIRFYQEVAPKSPIRTPRLVHADIDSENGRFALLMEDCSQYTPVDPQVKGLSREHTELITLKLAGFQARWWDSEELRALDWLPGAGAPETLALTDIFRGCWDACAQMPGFREALPDGGWEAGLRIREHYDWLIGSIPGGNLTIGHSDFRVDNMFFDWDTPDDPLVVFDWGAAYATRGAGDLAYLVGACVATDVRRRIEKDILRLYNTRLVQAGVSGYSEDECWSDYLRGLLIFTIILVLAYSSLDMSDPRGTELLRVGLDRWFTAIIDNDATSILP